VIEFLVMNLKNHKAKEQHLNNKDQIE
jgi:hypothetical protein